MGTELKYHSLYWSFHTAFQPSGTLGGGGPVGAAKSAIVDDQRFQDLMVSAERF